MKKMKKITTLDDLAKGGKINIDDIAAEAEKMKSEEEAQEKKDPEKTGDSEEPIEKQSTEGDTEPKTEL